MDIPDSTIQSKCFIFGSWETEGDTIKGKSPKKKRKNNKKEKGIRQFIPHLF